MKSESVKQKSESGVTAFPRRTKERTTPSLHLAKRERNTKRRDQQKKIMESESVKPKK